MSAIVFVCTGNICRSPMAEGIMKKRAEEAGRSDIQVSSMGIHGLDRQAAFDFAVEVCARQGIDISDHLSRQLDPDELKGAEFIFVMELVQKEFINVFFPQVADRIFLLGSWPEKENRKGNIKDPIGGSEIDYQKAFSAISGHIDRILPYVLH